MKFHEDLVNILQRDSCLSNIIALDDSAQDKICSYSQEAMEFDDTMQCFAHTTGFVLWRNI